MNGSWRAFLLLGCKLINGIITTVHGDSFDKLSAHLELLTANEDRELVAILG